MHHDQRRPNVLEVDLGAVEHYVGKIRDYVGRSVKIFAALKCRAYGLGLSEVAHAASKGGTDGTAVVDRENAIELRENNVAGPIIVYPGSVLNEAAGPVLQRYDLTPTLIDLAEARALSRSLTRPIPVAVKIDLGQERLGFVAEQAAAAIVDIGQMPNLRVALVNSHPNVPKGDGPEYRAWQMKRLQAVLDQLKMAGVPRPTTLIASSRLLAQTDALKFDAIDPGQMLFGPLCAEGDVPWPTTRRALHALRSRIVHVKQIDRREFIDSAPFPIRAGMRIGVIPMGSADGIETAHCGYVLAKGRRAPLIAASLEHTRIDITDIPEATVGDEVVLIGAQGDERILPDDVVKARNLARLADISIGLRASVSRVYF